MASFRTIVGSKKILMNTGSHFELKCGFIEVVGTQIVDVILTPESEFFEKIEEYRNLERVKVCAYPDAMITPAFVNSHSHVTMAFFRGLPGLLKDRKNIVEDAFFKVETKLTADDVRAFSRMGGYECLLNGVGLVWDHYYHGTAVADAFLDIGMCGVVAPTLQDKAGPGVQWLDKMLEETLEIQSAKRFAVGGVYAALGPHATDTVSPALWKKVAALSKTKALPIHAHLGQSIEEVRRSQSDHGKTPVQMLEEAGVLSDAASCVWAHGIYVSNSDLKKLKLQNHTMVFCPYSQMVFHFPADIARWEKHNLNWVVATDCVASNDSMNVQKELRYVSGFPTLSTTYSAAYQGFEASGDLSKLVEVETLRAEAARESEKFTNPEFLLPKAMGTAGAMHPAFVAGTVAKGALANLVVWDLKHPSFWPALDPLSTLCRGDTSVAIVNTMVAGRMVGEDYNYVSSIVRSVDYEDARAEAMRRLELLVEKV